MRCAAEDSREELMLHWQMVHVVLLYAAALLACCFQLTASYPDAMPCGVPR
jgi:hypothetical protein